MRQGGGRRGVSAPQRRRPRRGFPPGVCLGTANAVSPSAAAWGAGVGFDSTKLVCSGSAWLQAQTLEQPHLKSVKQHKKHPK